MRKKILATIILGAALSLVAPASNAFAATTNGWEQTNGTWYYYENGVKSTSKWVQGNDGKWYYLNANGAMATNQWVKHTDGKWYYLESDGAMATNKWINHTDGKYYYVGSDGAMLTDTYTPDGYYVDANGAWDGQSASNGQAIVAEAKKYIGKPYVWGADGPNSFDCSGFTRYVYLQVTGRDITRTTYTQVNQGTAVSRGNLRAGDLIFFNNTASDGRNPSHVGIYIGNDQFIHASSSKGVTISYLSNSYYSSHYGCARRIL